MAWWDTALNTAKDWLDIGEPYEPPNMLDTIQGYHEDIRSGPTVLSPEWFTSGIGSGSSGGATGSSAPVDVWNSPEWNAAVESLGSSEPTIVQGYSAPTTADGPALEAYKDALRRMAAGGGGGGGGAAVGGDSTGALRSMRQQVDAEYGALLGRLDQLYQTAETDEERAMIEFALADLDDQYRTAVESIGMVYDQADEQVGGYVESAQERAAGVGDLVRAQGEQAVERALQQEAMARALLGEQFGDAFRGATAGQTGQTALQADLTNMQTDRESSYRQDMADLSAEDAAWIEAQLGGQRAANTAEAGRIQAMLRNRAVQEHQNRVTQRVNAERMARAQAEQQLVQNKLQALQQLAQQEAQLRQSDINSRRSAAASRSGSASQALGAYAKLAELEAAQSGNGVTLPSLRLPSGERVGPGGGFNNLGLQNDLVNLQQEILAEPSAFNALAGGFVRNALGGYEDPALAAQAEQWLWELIEPWDVYDQAKRTASSSGSSGAGTADRALLNFASGR